MAQLERLNTTKKGEVVWVGFGLETVVWGRLCRRQCAAGGCARAVLVWGRCISGVYVSSSCSQQRKDSVETGRYKWGRGLSTMIPVGRGEARHAVWKRGGQRMAQLERLNERSAFKPLAVLGSQ